MDQPGKVANPARGQLNRENNIPLSPCVPENLVSRDGFSRPVPRQPAHLHTQAESGAYLRDSSRVPRRRPYETAIRHRVSPEFIGSRNCVPMALTAESPPAQGRRTIESLVHKIRLHRRRGKGMAESFWREKLRHAPQKKGG